MEFMTMDQRFRRGFIAAENLTKQDISVPLTLAQFDEAYQRIK